MQVDIKQRMYVILLPMRALTEGGEGAFNVMGRLSFHPVTPAAIYE